LIINTGNNMHSTRHYIELLSRSRFLEGASEELLRGVANIAYEVSLKAGETLVKKGDLGVSLYVVMEGLVRVYDGDIRLNDLTSGHVIGEIAALGSLERTATVVTVENTTFLAIDKKPLVDVLAGNSDFIEIVMAMLCRREKSMANNIRDRSMRVLSLEKEMEIGRRIQAGFLPDKLPKPAGWDIATYFEAAREVAGDFYDVFNIQTLDRVGLIIGDVCDKGVGAALFMTLFRSLLRSTALAQDFHNWGEGSGFEDTNKSDQPSQENATELCLRQSIMLTNNYIAQTHGSTSMFASIFFALLDPRTGSLTYINAGHEEPIIFNNEGVKQRLGITGPVVGIFPGAKFNIGKATMEPGDCLLAFTDGVTEAIDTDGNQFSEARLLTILASDNRSSNELLSDIIHSLQGFTAGTTQYDDTTLLAAQYTGDK
jgi:sigma-B regulation protein RsbU (phosphoserine phosphatase)